MPNFKKFAALASKHKVPLVVDNTCATPYLVKPVNYGADIVIHSATKFLAGHGAVLGGLVIDSGKFDWAASGADLLLILYILLLYYHLSAFQNHQYYAGQQILFLCQTL